jgi:hypothetical protein
MCWIHVTCANEILKKSQYIDFTVPGECQSEVQPRTLIFVFWDFFLYESEWPRLTRTGESSEKWAFWNVNVLVLYSHYIQTQVIQKQVLTCFCTCMYIYIHTHTQCMYVCMYVYVYIYIYIYIMYMIHDIYMYMYMYIWWLIYIHKYIHNDRSIYRHEERAHARDRRR